MNNADMTKSYFDLMLEREEQAEESSSKATEVTKETAETISRSKFKVEELLRRLDKKAG